MQEKLNKIEADDVELYLKTWGYKGITFRGNSEWIRKLEEICRPLHLPSEYGSILIVTDQDENSIRESAEGSYGIRQLLYELEVFSDIPSEVREKVSAGDWMDFILRFIRIYSEEGWQVYCSKFMPLAEEIRECLGRNVILSGESVKGTGYEKYMILQNGHGGLVHDHFIRCKDFMRIEERRMIVLFRAYIMELICSYFKNELLKKDVELFTVNWKWALNDPLYPKENVTSSDIENRSLYSVSQIANNETAFEDFLKQIYGEAYSPDYVREVMDIPNRLRLESGSVEHEDRFGKYLNVFRGERKTTGQPSDYDHTVYLMGGCVFFGYAVEDGQTIASFLQDQLNRKLPEKKWRVINYGTWGGDIDWTYKRFYQIPFKPGDMVIVSYAGYMPLGPDWENRDISRSLKQVRSKEEFYFNSIVHCNHLGYEQAGAGLLDMFHRSFAGVRASGDEFYLEDTNDRKRIYEDQVEEYVKSVAPQLPDLAGRDVGAIVMNCNPFTLGHQYLIEYASKQVEILIIFVVEENKSYFEFEDRIKLVRQGTQHLENVYVIPSGKMIISTVTFPGYFLKDTPEAVNLDTSMDVSIFGEYIAKAFHIKTRFVGEEPFDIVTRNYNESMKDILPRYGIKLVIIPRKENGGSAISASRVRKLLEKNNFEEIRALVPETTYMYLCDKYKRQ